MIKKYWPFFAVGVVAFFAFVLLNKDYKAEYFGEMAKRKVESQLNAEQKTMLDWYAERLKEKDAQIDSQNMDIALIGADATKWHGKSVAASKKISELLTCNEKLVATNALLVECQNYVLELNQNYQNGVEELGDLWGQKFALNLREIDELRLANNSLISKVGDYVKKITILESTKRNRLNFAIFGGVDLVHRDFAAGVGLSFNLFPIKFRLF